MRVAKWGNSLAIRLPAAVVETLELREGDEVEVHVAGERAFDIARDRGRQRGPVIALNHANVSKH
jgi:antitoxin MazE